MADIVDRRTRSRMMSRIKGRDTQPELVVRKGLHRRGLRYSLHRPDLPGRPDIVLPAYGTVILVHGCFWHCHDCSNFRMPGTNRKFWEEKLGGNKKRDLTNLALLFDKNWYVGIVWECAIRGQKANLIERKLDHLVGWIIRTRYKRKLLELADR